MPAVAIPVTTIPPAAVRSLSVLSKYDSTAPFSVAVIRFSLPAAFSKAYWVDLNFNSPVELTISEFVPL